MVVVLVGVVDVWWCDVWWMICVVYFFILLVCDEFDFGCCVGDVKIVVFVD